MPEIRSGRRSRSKDSVRQGSREARRKARWRQRVGLGVMVLVMGASLGIVVAWWSGRAPSSEDAAPSTAPGATTTTAVAPAQGKAPQGLVATAPAATPPAAAASAVVPASTAKPAPSAGHAALKQLDVAELLRERSSGSSGWLLARLRGNPAVMVLQFPNLAEQGSAMNRIAALVEKAGAPRDRVLSDLELSALITSAGDNPQTFYQGHDYVAEQIALFRVRIHAE